MTGVSQDQASGAFAGELPPEAQSLPGAVDLSTLLVDVALPDGVQLLFQGRVVEGPLFWKLALHRDAQTRLFSGIVELIRFQSVLLNSLLREVTQDIALTPGRRDPSLASEAMYDAERLQMPRPVHVTSSTPLEAPPREQDVARRDEESEALRNSAITTGQHVPIYLGAGAGAGAPTGVQSTREMGAAMPTMTMSRTMSSANAVSEQEFVENMQGESGEIVSKLRQANAMSLREIVLKLRTVLSTDTIAFITGTSDRGARNWLNGATRSARRDSEKRLLAGLTALLVLEEEEKPSVISRWFINRNRHLGERSPAEAIRDGRLREVMRAARTYAIGY